jgi:primosomal protein N' (replication factor Y)
MINSFADVILPLAVRQRFTYRIPAQLAALVAPGVKVLVQVGGKRLYQGIVRELHDRPPDVKNTRSIIDVGADTPPVNDKQLLLWSWISEYYMCSEGEVMKAAVPSALFAGGVTGVPLSPGYKPRQETFVKLARDFTDHELGAILDGLAKARAQAGTLESFLHMAGRGEAGKITMVKKNMLLAEQRATAPALAILEKKGFLLQVSMNTGRLKKTVAPAEPLHVLTAAQENALKRVKEAFQTRSIVLLHGITSSGKTEIYMHLIEEQLKLGRQVLYMLPEIALTTQVITRLQKHFGQLTGVYHSRFSDQERAEIWKRVAETDGADSYRLILGVRSSVFLPFSNLGLVIIDEEHDPSYKQHDPAPRYHGRDTAIMLAGFHKAKTLLGSALPSVESYYNAAGGKYGLAEISERFGHVNLPRVIVANTREAYRKRLMTSHFTPELLNATDNALARNEQVLLFQNRRGFSPYIQCPECGWIPLCINCAVNLTYHKLINRLVCHYCGYGITPPPGCGNCKSPGLVTRGFGTEKIEDEIKIIFPSARVLRVDRDSTRGRNSFARIVRDFEEHRFDILIGTQMISKGFDFENLTVVGILNADNLLNYPDFRAHERSYQVMEQVSGRAGRRLKQGTVIIQTADPDNEIIRLVLKHDFPSMYRLQATERETFNYPPYCRMIRLSLKHEERALLNGFADILGDNLRKMFGNKVLGPEYPVISRVQSLYVKTIIVKIGREKPLPAAKKLIGDATRELLASKGARSLKVAIDVDPY